MICLLFLGIIVAVLWVATQPMIESFGAPSGSAGLDVGVDDMAESMRLFLSYMKE